MRAASWCLRTACEMEVLRSLRSRLDERALAQLLERLTDLLLRVHHERAPARVRLLERLGREEEEASRLGAGACAHHVAVLQDDQPWRPDRSGAGAPPDHDL